MAKMGSAGFGNEAGSPRTLVLLLADSPLAGWQGCEQHSEMNKRLGGFAAEAEIKARDSSSGRTEGGRFQFQLARQSES